MVKTFSYDEDEFLRIYKGGNEAIHNSLTSILLSFRV